MKRTSDARFSDNNGRACLDGEPFTGINEFVDEEGRHEVTYVEGILTGLRRGWFPSGTPEYEYWMLMGLYHGKKREWHPNGQLAEEADYEFGVDLRHKLWDEEGNVIEEFKADLSNPDYDNFKAERKTYKEAIQEEKRRRKDSQQFYTWGPEWGRRY